MNRPVSSAEIGTPATSPYQWRRSGFVARGELAKYAVWKTTTSSAAIARNGSPAMNLAPCTRQVVPVRGGHAPHPAAVSVRLHVVGDPRVQIQASLEAASNYN